METAVLVEIEKLRRASLQALREKYREVFGEETQCRHRQHLFRRIAWRVQALAEGDLSEPGSGLVKSPAMPISGWWRLKASSPWVTGPSISRREIAIGGMRTAGYPWRARY